MRLQHEGRKRSVEKSDEGMEGMNLKAIKEELNYARDSLGNYPNEYGFELTHETVDKLVKIAEVAFELVPDLDSLVCSTEEGGVYCHGCAFDYGKYKHEETCLGVRIQDLKKELES